MKRFLRGSSSRSSKDKQVKKTRSPSIISLVLRRFGHVNGLVMSSWEKPGFMKFFYHLAENAGLTAFLHDQRGQYLLLTNIFVQNFHFHARRSPPSVEFYLYDEHKEMSLYDFCWICLVPFGGRQKNHIMMMWRDLLIWLLWGKRGKFPMQESLAYIFLFYVTLQYLLVDA